MNISIDFDDTYTRDPQLWNEFIRSAHAAGHTVYCVTARGSEYEDEVNEVLESIGKFVSPHNCIFTGGKQKRQFCLQRSIYINVWIDDMPEAIPNGTEHSFLED
jgi:acid phosphatase class B